MELVLNQLIEYVKRCKTLKRIDMYKKILLASTTVLMLSSCATYPSNWVRPSNKSEPDFYNDTLICDQVAKPYGQIYMVRNAYVACMRGKGYTPEYK